MAGLEPARALYGPTDFKSVASTIPPHRLFASYEVKSYCALLQVSVSECLCTCNRRESPFNLRNSFFGLSLIASGEPPNDIVRAVLKTNVSKARWVEIEPTPVRADYALRSSDGEYTAILNYKGHQLENMIWTMTVGLAKSVRAPSAAASPTTPSSPVWAPAPTSATTPLETSTPEDGDPNPETQHQGIAQSYSTL